MRLRSRGAGGPARGRGRLGPAALVLACLSLPWRLDAGEPAVVAGEIAGRVVFVRTTVNGRGPYPFVLDTGATETVVTPAAARSAGLVPRDASTVPARGLVRTLAVGAATVTNVPVLLFDPPQALSLRLDRGIDYGGILGYTFLAPFLTTIDYRRARVTFAPIGSIAVPRAGSVAAGRALQIPFVLRDRLIHVPVFVNGRGPFDFLVDTGSAEVVLLPGATDVLRLAATPGRADGARFATLERVRVGAAEVTAVPAVLLQPARDGGAAPAYDGILGYPVLSRFLVTVNYRDRVLTLVPPEPAGP